MQIQNCLFFVNHDPCHFFISVFDIDEIMRILLIFDLVFLSEPFEVFLVPILDDLLFFLKQLSNWEFFVLAVLLLFVFYLVKLFFDVIELLVFKSALVLQFN
jgi:hypothetical protein